MDVYCVLAGEVAGGRTGWLTTVTGSELAGEAQEFRPKKIASPVVGEGVPTPLMSRTSVAVAVYCIKSAVFGDACFVWERPDTINGF